MTEMDGFTLARLHQGLHVKRHHIEACRDHALACQCLAASIRAHDWMVHKSRRTLILSVTLLGVMPRSLPSAVHLHQRRVTASSGGKIKNVRCLTNYLGRTNLIFDCSTTHARAGKRWDPSRLIVRKTRASASKRVLTCHVSWMSTTPVAQSSITDVN